MEGTIIIEVIGLLFLAYCLISGPYHSSSECSMERLPGDPDCGKEPEWFPMPCALSYLITFFFFFFLLSSTE